MKKLNLGYVNYKQGLPEENIYYLPYSTGLLWSYAKTIPAISNVWDLGTILWRRDDIDSIYKQLADCDVLGLSTYVWNKNYNYQLGKKIKEYNPEIKIVLGGPEVAISNKNLFKEIPWADIVVKKEGEFTFAEILANIDSYHSIKGLCINDDGSMLDTGDANRIKDIDLIPSPYLTGIFDSLIKENPNVTWNAIFETNRGCPYQCTFCDWGSLTYSKVSKFNLERVCGELEWMARNRIDYVSVADANFGMFIERDEAIVDKMIELQETTGYPKRFNFSWAKNQKADVIKLVKKLYSAGMNNGLIVSTQSLTDNVLKNIKRQNLASNRLAETFDMCNKEGIAVTTELILGLPGETLHTWKQNLMSMLDLGLHNGMDIFIAQMLENSEMNLRQREEYAITTRVIENFITGSSQDSVIPEGVEIVTGTKDMPTDDMISAMVYSWFIVTMHISGTSQWYARVLKKKDVSFIDFYDGLWDFLIKEDWFQKEVDLAREQISCFMIGDKPLDKFLGTIQLDGSSLLYYGAFRMTAYKMQDTYLDAVRRHIVATYTLSLPLVEDLHNLTDAFIIRHEELGNYPIKLKLNHNIVDFVLNDANIEQSCILSLECNEKQMSLETFLRNIYFRRRRYFGKAKITHVAL